MAEKGILIAEGDSWFRLGPVGFDILNVLKNMKYEVRSVANHGDSLKKMVKEFDGEGGLKKKLEEISREEKQLSAILLSAGGNDLAGKEKKTVEIGSEEKQSSADLFLPGGNDLASKEKKTAEEDVYKLERLLNDNANDNSQSILNKDKVTEVIDNELYGLYENLISKIDQACKELSFSKPIPILIHGYGYVVPDGRGTGSGGVGNVIPELPGGDIGPWLRPAFHKKERKDLGENTQTMKELIDRFNSMIVRLTAKWEHVKHVDLRNLLSNSLEGEGGGLKKYQKDWADELHPTYDPGFKKIAKKFDRVLTNLP